MARLLPLLLLSIIPLFGARCSVPPPVGDPWTGHGGSEALAADTRAKIEGQARATLAAPLEWVGKDGQRSTIPAGTPLDLSPGTPVDLPRGTEIDRGGVPEILIVGVVLLIAAVVAFAAVKMLGAKAARARAAARRKASAASKPRKRRRAAKKPPPAKASP